MSLSKKEFALAGALAVFAGVIFALPYQVLGRFGALPVSPDMAVFAIYGFAATLMALAVAIMTEGRSSQIGWMLFAMSAVAVFGFQVQHLADWWIDDAGITFSYARSLADGQGITFQPGQPPTEGYSSTLWMLILSGAGWLGFDIADAAKLMGILFGGITLTLAIGMIRQLTQRTLAAAVAIAVITATPFAVWSASGQEHALQALLLTLVALSLGRDGSVTWPTLWLSLLVLTRPEAPIIVAGCFFAAVGYSFRTGRGFELRRNLPLALVPFVVFVGLIAFRMTYFGDPLPNPYYAKTAQSSLVGLINPFGGGWYYVFSYLISSAAVVALPFVFAKPAKEHRKPVFFVAVVVVAHLIFVVWAKGDWMGQFRFIMPVLPVFGVLVAVAFARMIGAHQRVAVTALVVGVVAMNTVYELNRFKAAPTTPLSVVSQVGHGFADLGRRLGIDAPLLAHHDAGAIAYERSIGLVDLGGLVDRKIAQNMADAAYLEQYVLVERRPDFVFGAHNFAAQSGFLRTERFARDYVPVRFADAPVMTSDYAHVRRDRVAERPGIALRRNAAGAVVEMIVSPVD